MVFMIENPIHQNILVALATVVYVKAVVGSCELLVSKQLLSLMISRKTIHIAAGSLIAFWPLFDTDHWTWKLNVLVPAIYAVQLFVKGAILRDPTDPDVQTMTRTGSPTELLNGPLLFAILMIYVGLELYGTQLGVVILACLTYGDGIAPLVGYYFPCGTHYLTFPFGKDDKKTLMGSLGFWGASVIGYFILKGLILEEHRDFAEGHAEFQMIATLAAVVAVVEGLCGPYDNPCIALSAILTYRQLLPA
jgi:dolichol kinase